MNQVLVFAPENLRKDREVRKKEDFHGMRQTGAVSDEVVLAAVRQNGKVGSLKATRKSAAHQATSIVQALVFAHESLKNDKEVESKGQLVQRTLIEFLARWWWKQLRKAAT